MCHALLFLCDSQQLPRDSWTIAEYVSRMRSISISQESRRRTKTAVRLTQINKITGTVTTVGVIGKSRPRRQDRLFTLSTSWTEIACKCQCGPTRQPNTVQLSLFWIHQNVNSGWGIEDQQTVLEVTEDRRT